MKCSCSVHGMLSFVYVISSSGDSGAHLAVFEYPMRFTRYDYFSILNTGNTKGTTSGAGITHSFKAYSVMICGVPFLVFSVHYL